MGRHHSQNAQESGEIRSIEVARSAEDRRKSSREELVVRVDYQTVDELFSEFARNINEGGMFLETDSPHPAGTVVDLQFRLPGSDDPLHVRGTVVHVGTDEGVPGMGIEFGELDAASRARINELVRTLRASTTR